LSREQAARFIGISPGKFDELVRTGAMPQPKTIGTRRVWCSRAVDLAFDALPELEDAGANAFDGDPL